MTRRASNVTPFRSPSNAEAEGRAALRILGLILKAIKSSAADQKRIVDYCRVSNLTGDRGPFSKATIHRYIENGQLEAVRLGGITLISIESVNKLLGTAEPWTPRDKDG